MLTLKFHCPCNGNEISVLAFCRVDLKSFEEKLFLQSLTISIENKNTEHGSYVDHHFVRNSEWCSKLSLDTQVSLDLK